ncbi:MAG: hypothetical protein AAB038_00680 [Planctomycetota bacterium]
MQNWIRHLVQDFRTEYAKLSKQDKENVSNLDNLSSPLQVEVFVIKNHGLMIQDQLFIFTHFKDKPDLDIIVNESDSNEASEKLKEKLKDEKWQRKLPEDEIRISKNESKRIYATLLEGLFIDLLRSFKGGAFITIFSKQNLYQAGIGMKRRLTDDSFSWKASGNVQQLDTKK